VDSVQEVIFWVDADDSWVFLNPAWQQITGFPLHESMGHNWMEFVSPADYDRVSHSLQHVRQERLGKCRETFRLRTTGQHFRWVELHARLVYSEDGLFTGMSGTLTDVTERKLNEENTIRLAVQERSIEIQRQLLAGLSHDIRTPLAIISTSAYLGQHQFTSAEKRQAYLGTIAQQIDLLTRMIERIAMVAKLTIGDVPFNFVKTQLNGLIQQVVVKRQELVQDNHVSPRLQLDPALPLIVADEYWMMEMIDNLLMNAIQNTPSDGEICLSTSVCSTGVMMQISDTGTGIAPEVLPNIFDPLYTADKARSNTGYSVGLGLTIVRQVVSTHGGQIEVESEVGHGTTFRILLPLQAAIVAGSV
jgi:PAS domain S-box-containing protein